MVCLLSVVGCSRDSQEELNCKDYHELVSLAKDEGHLVSLAMPDEWANWAETWKDIDILYGIRQRGKNMNSAEVVKSFSRGDNADLGDVGVYYAKLAATEKLTLPYKTSYWDTIPKWAKDEEGHWSVAYTGTLAFLIDQNRVHKDQLTWQELADGKYTVGIGNVVLGTLSQYTVYGANVAFGGDMNNIEPGMAFFEKLAREGRLVTTLEKDEDSLTLDVDVQVRWDFMALRSRDTGLTLPHPRRFKVCIPQDGSVTVGYSIIINKNAQNPYTAALAKEYIFSDAGQINLARGYANPVRTVYLPEELQARRIDGKQYSAAMIKNGVDFNDKVAEAIIKEWKKRIIPLL